MSVRMEFWIIVRFTNKWSVRWKLALLDARKGCVLRASVYLRKEGYENWRMFDRMNVIRPILPSNKRAWHNAIAQPMLDPLRPVRLPSDPHPPQWKQMNAITFHLTDQYRNDKSEARANSLNSQVHKQHNYHQFVLVWAPTMPKREENKKIKTKHTHLPTCTNT